MSRVFVFITFFLISFFSCKYNSIEKKENVNDESVKALTDFYQNYIKLNVSNKINDEKIDSLKELYVEKTLLMKLKESNIDFDPFVDAQDFDEEWLNNLTVLKNTSKINLYKVCLDKGYCIDVYVNEENKIFNLGSLEEYLNYETEESVASETVLVSYNSHLFNYKIINKNELNNFLLIENQGSKKIQEIAVPVFDSITVKTFFDLNSKFIYTNFGVEKYEKFVIADFNFDKREDIAYINSQGGNGGPTYNYYLQNNKEKFVLNEDLTQNMSFFPTEINNEEKTLTISHPDGCCKVVTYKIQLQPSGEWKEIFHEISDISTQ